ncbi:MAG: hypothetical protein ACRBN8_15980 [Nannocystales bacterium]
MIEEIVARRAGENEIIMKTTRTKLILKGIEIGRWSETSDDDPAILARLEQIALELGVRL